MAQQACPRCGMAKGQRTENDGRGVGSPIGNEAHNVVGRSIVR
jgi:hypothetical protein